MKLLPSQRGHLYVFERARIYQHDGRVEYAVDQGREPLSFNVPIANTSFLLIGPGSSITTEAVRLLKQAGVCIGFCGSGGTPLLSADDPYPDFLCPADEYRDPDCVQEPWTFFECPFGRQEAGGDFPTKAARVPPKQQLLGLSPDIILAARFPDAGGADRGKLMQRFLRTAVPQEATDCRELWRYYASYGLHR